MVAETEYAAAAATGTAIAAARPTKTASSAAEVEAFGRATTVVAGSGTAKAAAAVVGVVEYGRRTPSALFHGPMVPPPAPLTGDGAASPRGDETGIATLSGSQFGA